MEHGPRAQCMLDLPRPGHSAKPTWAVWPTIGRGWPIGRVSWHSLRRFTGDYPTDKLRTDVNPSDEASPGTAWPEAEAMDIAHRGPHGAQRAVLVRSVALPVTAGDWMARGKMSTGSIHGPQRTYLTWSQVLNRSEEGGRRRGGAHQHGRWCRSSTTVKVSVLWVGEQLWALVKL
jgi:hypothetical protein